MDNSSTVSENQKHEIAYRKLKEIQRRYGFENIANLRSFFRELRNIFQDYDRPQESMKGEEVNEILHKVFTFFSNIDELTELDIQAKFNALKQEMEENKVNPSIISSIWFYYQKRINSDIEKLRREIIKGEKIQQNAIATYYTNKWEQELREKDELYTNSIREALHFAFQFPNETTDWSKDYEKSFASFEQFEIPHIISKLKLARVPEEFINEFIKNTNNLEAYKERNKRIRGLNDH